MHSIDLEKKTAAALEKPPLSRTVVMRACGRLAGLLTGGAYDGEIRARGLEKLLTRERICQAAFFLREDTLERRVKTELLGLQNRLLPCIFCDRKPDRRCSFDDFFNRRQDRKSVV